MSQLIKNVNNTLIIKSLSDCTKQKVSNVSLILYVETAIVFNLWQNFIQTISYLIQKTAFFVIIRRQPQCFNSIAKKN